MPEKDGAPSAPVRTPEQEERFNAIIDEMDAQIYMLGRLLTSRHVELHGHGADGCSPHGIPAEDGLAGTASAEGDAAQQITPPQGGIGAGGNFKAPPLADGVTGGVTGGAESASRVTPSATPNAEGGLSDSGAPGSAGSAESPGPAAPAAPPAAPQITPPQGLLLKILSLNGPTRPTELATLMGVRAPAVSSLVDGLERLGFAERVPDTEDRRATRVAMTESGVTALEAGEARRRTMLRRYVSVLTDEDLESLLRIQRTLIEAMVANRI